MIGKRRTANQQIKKVARYLRRRKLSVAAGTLAVLLFTLAAVFYNQTSHTLIVRYKEEAVDVNQPVLITFTQEVRPHFNYSLSPGVLGRWNQLPGLFGTTGLIFVPDTKLVANTDYSVNITGLERLLGEPLPDQTVEFTTERPAAVASVSPADTVVNVATDSVPSVKLAAANNGLRILNLTLDNGVTLAAATSSDDQTFTWKPTSPLTQGVTYHATLRDLSIANKTRQIIKTWSFTTVAEPAITAATTTDHLNPGDKLTVAFNQPMQHHDGDLTFSLKGSGQWVNDTTYEFTPTGLTPGTGYDYVVHKGTKSVAGGVVLVDHPYHLSTPGAVYVTGSSPGGSGVSRLVQIKFSFDQPVDHASAQAHFAISPAASTSFAWSGNTLVASTSGLGWQTSYTASVSAGIVPVFGLPSAKAFSTSFTTEAETVRLNVPMFYQVYAQSCEEAALRMALSYRGINVNDFDVLNQAGYNPRSRDNASNSWDNPYKQFVGDVNGSQRLGTGYGVFSDPIAKASRNLGRNATAYHGVDASFISNQIHAGNPVVVWGYSSQVAPHADSWNTPDGVIATYFGEHTRTVTGVYGSAANPIGFYLNDPAIGPLYWSAAQMNAQLNSFGGASNQAVVVF